MHMKMCHLSVISPLAEVKEVVEFLLLSVYMVIYALLRCGMLGRLIKLIFE